MKKKKKKPTPSLAPVKPPVERKKNENPFLNKPNISVNKDPNNTFQNVPVSSLQKFKYFYFDNFSFIYCGFCYLSFYEKEVWKRIY